ncbi:VTT domain-containing protein [Pseudoflavonifractor sp. An85]|uniref:TVP38/TMEM64 family protein n=1 Tax=Pseudoflavonifractor sp. An85 TaxID=1965661 RepID=UPI001FA900B3|nr:VTT domain-containing protein [Pseudoflavonifractor sp. An85]
MNPRLKQALLWLFTLALLGGSVYALYATGFFQTLHSKEAMEAYIASYSPWSHLMYFAIQLISVIVAPIPSNITALVGAVMFGFWPAFLLTWGAVVLGSVVVFLLARMLGQKFVHQFVGEKVSDKYLDLIERKRDVFLFLAFLFPFFPDDLLCILAGLTDLSWKRFLFLCLVARPWGLLVACAVGGSTLSVPPWGMALMGLVGLAIFLVAMRYGDQVEQAILRRLKKD